MKRLYTLFVVVLLALIPLSWAGAAPAQHPRIDPLLQRKLAGAQANAPIDVLIVMNDQFDLRTVRNQNRTERRRALILSLKKMADRSQRALRKKLQELRVQGQVAQYTPLWVQNAVIASATPAAISQIAALPGVGAVIAVQSLSAPTAPQAPASTNLSVVRAPELWALGYYGQGVVVASLDTGVDGSHPDLSGSWRGGSNSWFDPSGEFPSTPTDMSGHGTWTMGVMVGGENSGTAVGVAPGATWIAARIFNNAGSASTAHIHLALQWILDPDGNPQTDDAPDVVNNSWSFGGAGCNLEFAPDLQALITAGIVPVFAAGNYGSSASTDTSPANNPGALSVGAVTTTDRIYSYSSRGPTSCGRSEATTFPDLVAPGVGILTTDLYEGYYTPSGTSLAAPHVAGGLAVLLSAFPALGAEQQRSAILSTLHDLGTLGPDSTYGGGRLDLLAAYTSLLNASSTPTPTETSVPIDTSTATATSTPTSTSTATATNTPTSTSTATATNTPTSTSTATAINTPTSTSTATATNIPTSTPTKTPLPPTSTPTKTPGPPTATRTPLSAAPIFADGFESGNLSAWSAASTASGRLKVSTAAALVGGYGLEAALSSTTAIYVSDAAPVAEAKYNAQLRLDPNSAGLIDTNVLRVLAARSSSGTELLRLELRRSSGSYQLRVSVRNGTTYKSTTWTTISDAPHLVEVRWVSASTGSVQLLIDGGLAQQLTAVSNASDRVEDVRLGALSGIASGTTGTLYLDAFSATR